MYVEVILTLFRPRTLRMLRHPLHPLKNLISLR